MDFIIIGIVALAVLAIVAAICSHFDKGDDTIVEAEGCAGCTGKEDCKLACIIEEKKKKTN